MNKEKISAMIVLVSIPGMSNIGTDYIMIHDNSTSLPQGDKRSLRNTMQCVYIGSGSECFLLILHTTKFPPVSVYFTALSIIQPSISEQSKYESVYSP
ncbi:Uncharacterised protein [Paenibacillus polymyxa]|nr:Uncharacterised protein [Paenibacillus polymyxa]